MRLDRELNQLHVRRAVIRRASLNIRHLVHRYCSHVKSLKRRQITIEVNFKRIRYLSVLPFLVIPISKISKNFNRIMQDM